MNTFTRSFLALFQFGILGHVLAAPPNTIMLDGRPLEYDAGELRGTNPQTNTDFGVGNVITNLFVTWDAEYIYFALQGWEVGDKLTIMLDADPGAGTGATTTTNWSNNAEPFIAYNDVGWVAGASPDFGLDYQIASEGLFNNIMRIRYNGIDSPSTNNIDRLFDAGNGVNPLGTPTDMVVLANDLEDPLKGTEARIPWSVLYTNDYYGVIAPGHSVPTGATIRLFAVLHNNDPGSSYSSDGIIPNQVSPGAVLASGLWTTTDYIDVVIDADNDGLPDLGVGDVNAPFLSAVSGVQGKRQLYATFNEPVISDSATNVVNWLIGAAPPNEIIMIGNDAVLMTLSDDLPAAGTLIKVEANGIQDLATNSKVSVLYLNPASSGIETSVTVRFVLNKNFGMGHPSSSPRATTAFHVNGNAAPLGWGYPPFTNALLSSLNSTQVYRDVVFPPGTAQKIRYKYSAMIDGTNNYEAVRLNDYTEAARELNLPLDGSTLVVTDYLGAAAAPLRDNGSTTNYYELEIDPRRGDPGVRQNATVKFSLDLNGRNIDAIDRVILLGTDPLRGFNIAYSGYAGLTGLSDYPAVTPTVDQVGWDQGGIEMYDDGTNGDDIPGDGIFTIDWPFTTTGLDGAGESLVGGVDGLLPPYFGISYGLWLDDRSPRSFDYKFAVLTKSGQPLLSPEGGNLGYYLGPSDTTVTLNTHVWSNENLPVPPPSNSPTMFGLSFSNSQTVVTFEGTDLSHGVRISTNLNHGWMDFGHRASTTATPNVWRALVSGAVNPEHYMAFSGNPQDQKDWYWQPNVLPSTGGVVRYFYNQHSRFTAGARNIGVTGSFLGWGAALPSTFETNGWWYFDLAVAGTDPVITQFKTRTTAGDWEGGDNNYISRGFVRAEWVPLALNPGDNLTITYNANGGVLAAATNVNLHAGYGANWTGAQNYPMSLKAGETNIWEVTIATPTNARTGINFVFNNQPTAPQIWDSKDAAGGLNWRVFFENPRNE